MKLSIVALAALTSQASGFTPVNPDRDWFAAGNLSGMYACVDPAADFDECISSKLALSSNVSRFIKLRYQLPTLHQDMGTSSFWIPRGISVQAKSSAETGWGHYFSLEAPLCMGHRADDELMYGQCMGDREVAELRVAQMLFTSDVEERVIDQCNFDGTVCEEVCLGPITGDDPMIYDLERCTPQKFKTGQYTYSMIGLQNMGTTADPSSANFTLISEVDTSMGFSKVTLESDDPCSEGGELDSNSCPENVRSITLEDTTSKSKLRFTFPTATNINNEVSDPSGAFVTVEWVSPTSFKIKVETEVPGEGKFVMYRSTIEVAPSTDRPTDRPTEPTEPTAGGGDMSSVSVTSPRAAFGFVAAAMAVMGAFCA